jgi:hypothetical protein
MIYNTQKKTHNYLTMSSATHKGKLTIAFDVIHKSQKKDHKFCLQSHPQPQKKAHKILPSKSSTTPKESSQNFAFKVIHNPQKKAHKILPSSSSPNHKGNLLA